jgi:hypothetical protein
MDVSAILSLIERYGMPTVAAVAVSWLLWRVLRFIGTKVIEPCVASHISLTDAMQKNLASQAEHQAKEESLLGSIHGKLEQQNILLARMSGEVVEPPPLRVFWPEEKEAR